MKQHLTAQPKSSSALPLGRQLAPIRSQLLPQEAEGRERSPALNHDQPAITASGHSFATLALYAPEHSPQPVIQPKRQDSVSDSQGPPVSRQTQPNRTGLPDRLRTGIEMLSDINMDNVNVHYNSSQPARLNALAYAQGRDIHIAPSQEHHLPHEAWHIVQQAQGRVKPTTQLKQGVAVNDDEGLEHEADRMGAQALQLGQPAQTGSAPPLESSPSLPRGETATTPPAQFGAIAPVQDMDRGERKEIPVYEDTLIRPPRWLYTVQPGTAPAQPKRILNLTSSRIIQRVRKTNVELLDLTVKAFDDHRKSEQMDWANTPGFSEAQRNIIWQMIDWGVSGLAAIKLDDVVQEIEARPISQGYLKEYCTAVDGGETVQLEAVADLPIALKQGKWVARLNATVGGSRVKATIPRDKFEDLIADETVATAFINYYTNQHPILQTKDGREVWAFRLLVGVEGARISDYTTELPEIRNYHKFKKAALDKLKTDLTAPTTTPLMLVLYSMFDHNGAFHRHEEMHKVITDTHNRVLLLEDMNPDRILALKEGGLKRGSFDQLALDHGMGGKITQAVLAGHGDTHSVELGGKDTKMVGRDVRMDGYFPATFDPANVNATMWAEFFEALFKNMETKGGFSPKLLLRACLTNSNEVDLPKLKEFMRTAGIIDLDTVVDTTTPENQALIRDGINRYIVEYGSIATKMQTLAGGRAEVLGANASITASSTGSIKPTGELSIIALTDSAVDKKKIVYVQHGTEPVGAIKAVIESWAKDPVDCFAKMDLRIAAPVATNDDFVIHLLYQTIKATYANDILGANAFTHSAHALSSVVKCSTECRVKALTGDAMIQKHAVAFYGALLGHGPIAAVDETKLVIYQAWLLEDDAKKKEVADTLGQVNFDRNNAKDYVDITAISSKIADVLADGTASQRGRDLLALIGFIENNNLACKNYLVAQAIGVGNLLPQRIKDELRGYNEKNLRLALGLPEEIVPVLPPPLPLGSVAPPPSLHQPNVKINGGSNYFVEPLPTGVKKMTKTSLSDWAHVRQEPKATGAEIESYYLSRDFTLVGEVKSGADVPLGWYMIKLADGKVAYIEKKYF